MNAEEDIQPQPQVAKGVPLLGGQNAVHMNPEMVSEWETHERRLRSLGPPAIPVLRNRWIRDHFRHFCIRWMKQRFIPVPHPLGTDEYIFSLQPNLKKDWDKKLEKLNQTMPTNQWLTNDWFKKRRLDFEGRWRRLNTSLGRDKIKENMAIDKEIASFCHLRKNFKFWFIAFNNFAFVEFLVFLCAVMFKVYHF